MTRMETVKNDLRAHEGFRDHAYRDHLGFWTIGYGRLIDRRKGGGISVEEAEMLLENDIREVSIGLSQLISFWPELPSQVQRALINMAFQMGVRGVLAFRKTLAHLADGQYAAAADEALNSRWARQTPVRAKEVTEWMRWAA